MAERLIPTGRIVTVFGGSGFIGRQVVRKLAKRGWRIRVATRRPDLAFHLQPSGRVGQIHAVQANLRNPASVARALQGADAAVNLVGILAESGRQNFEAVHAFGARAVARAVHEAGISRLVHMSALGADENSPADYARTKGRGEAAVRDIFPAAIITRPSVVFGPEDDFFNRFAEMARFLPIIPLIGAETKFEPVFVGDVAEVIARGVDGNLPAGSTWELGGSETRSLRELVVYVCAVTRRKRLLVPVPFGPGHYMAWGTEIATALSLGIFPKILAATRDQVRLLRRDNVVSAEAVRSGRTLKALGIEAETIGAIVPTYLYRYRKTGQYADERLTSTTTH
ncbi:MAG TPA: complex I NDUFA9 subunit family protein [Beijerinckiaceae bacterium]|jgi:NADH dehydrogenase|nr:complex I NDUFA9 subunit family protein [Beijerinckiaceae bacterium]